MSNIFEYKAKIEYFKDLIRKEKSRLHKVLVMENKSIFRLIDILVIICILMNFGAVVITNQLVVRTNREEGLETKFYEVNPSMAKYHGFEVHPEYKELVLSLLKHLFLWFIIIICFLYYRLTMIHKYQLIIMAIITIIYFILFGLDFCNDLGYLIGTV